MQIELVDMLALTILAEAVGTIVLSIALLALYWRSNVLRYVLPLALSYCWIASIAVFRAWGFSGLRTPSWALWHIVLAFALGDAGLLVLLSRAWPRRGPTL